MRIEHWYPPVICAVGFNNSDHPNAMDCVFTNHLYALNFRSVRTQTEEKREDSSLTPAYAEAFQNSRSANSTNQN
jgi:hypothetical protein